MKKHFHIQKYSQVSHFKFTFCMIAYDVHYEHTVWKSTRSKTLMYKKEKLFIPRAMWFLYSYFPHGDILMGPRHQLLIINISHLPLSAQQTLLDPVVSSMCWADGK